MITIVTAHKNTTLDQVTLFKVMKHVSGNIYTTYEVYDNFKGVAHNRPRGVLLHMLKNGAVDKVLQVGYTGRKTKIVEVAEERGMDVVLFRSVE